MKPIVPGRFNGASISTEAGEIDLRLSDGGNWQVKARKNNEFEWRLLCNGHLDGSVFTPPREEDRAPIRLGSLTIDLVALSLALSESASADLSFCSLGTGAGQCNEPEGVAVDRTSGSVYVVDQGNRIDVFSSSGAFVRAFGWVADGTTNALQVCTARCHKGIAGSGSGSGQFLIGEGAIAVDNDPAIVLNNYS